MLDRSPQPDYWDDFFRPPWTRLSPAELEAVTTWVACFAGVQPDAFHDNSYERTLATLALLKDLHAGA